METTEEFAKVGHELIDWLTNYFNTIEHFPVTPDMQPGDIEKQISESPPKSAEDVNKILYDFKKYIMPGITHWQHPGFHAYFPANNSYPSVLAEIITAGLGVQGMKWITSPAATELEKVVMRWLQQLLQLPTEFTGVIMDTASVSTLCAILAAREKASNYLINNKGFENKVLRIYCSSEAHSSIDKAVRISGIGSINLVKVPVDSELRMIPEKLQDLIKTDIAQGCTPACIVGALGTTGSGAIDPIEEIGRIAHEYNCWFHVDAAYSGSALVLPEFRDLVTGLELADSFVFNPHKWLFTNFDCSAFFVRNANNLVKTFSMVPEYLQTGHEEDIDFSNWGIQLGRRFRSLKLWFVIRSFGVEGLREKLRSHIELGKLFESYILADTDFELVKPRNLNIICFRYVGKSSEHNEKNKQLLDKINNTGKVYLSHTIIEGKFTIRFVCGQTNVEKRHIDTAWEVIKQASKAIGAE